MKYRKKLAVCGGQKMRYAVLDRIRGLAVISMLLYHSIWDLVYLFHMDWTWYESVGAYVWQQSICWTFILLSGFCWSLGRNKWKRGAVVFGTGLLITAVTLLVMPQQRIVFGILTCLGSCMLFMIFLEKLLMKIPAAAGLTGSILLFLLFRNINDGFLGFETIRLVKLPEFLYGNLFMTYLGFAQREFYSADYFSLFPWMFLFTTGYFIYRILKENGALDKCAERGPGSGEAPDHALPRLFRYPVKGLEWIGKHSIIIYTLHQPVIYGVLTVILDS